MARKTEEPRSAGGAPRLAKQLPQQPPHQDPVQFAFQQLVDYGLKVDRLELGNPSNGKAWRLAHQDDKKGKKSGWYIAHLTRLDDSREVVVGAYGRFVGAECFKERFILPGRFRLNDLERARIKRQQDAANREADEARELAAREAAERAREIWAKLPSCSDSPYLRRKGVAAFGLGAASDGALAVPMRNAAGALVGLQFIQGDGAKKFLRGQSHAGAFHVIGTVSSEHPLILAEGYATAASCHQATGWPAAVCFDAGNLAAASVALRGKYPDIRFIFAGDDDHEKKDNAGRKAVPAAALAVNGHVVFPRFKDPAGKKDFNDLHQAEGLEVLREQLLEAVKPAQARATNGHTRPGFCTDDKGIWWRTFDKRSEQIREEFVGPPLSIAADLRGVDQKDWGRLLVFRDRDGHEHRWGMPMSMLAGGCEEMRRELLRLGYPVSTRLEIRSLFNDYIQQAQPAERARSVEKTGWHDRVFVLPERTLGATQEDVLFQTETAATHVYRSSGDLAEWRTEVAHLSRGNSRLMFSLSAAFAAMLVHWAGEESGGFHLRGGSATGKTTALRVAASVYGGPSYLHRWRATDNALEAIAAGHSDTLLILDEIGQVDARVAGEVAYMLANGEGKARAHRSGGGRPVLTWRLLFLSAGEVGLSDHMQQAGKRAHAGQETRLADIPADAGLNLGVFEDLHGHKDGAVFSRALTYSAAKHYGTAAPAFIEAVLPLLDGLPEALRSERESFLRAYVPAGADGQVKRVGARFALVASAGELATANGITGWEKGEAREAVIRCFQAWLLQRGCVGNMEPIRMLQQVRLFLEQHGKSRFERWAAHDQDSGNYVIQNRAGFRRGELSAAGDSEEIFYVLPEVFREEVCRGLDARAVSRALAEAGCLRREGARQYTRKERLPGVGHSRCYVITPAIFQVGEDGKLEKSAMG
jgi:putative DNA primase/helicase